ncbi:DUF6350 family protein [Streptomyces sp. BI20]|uniref:cell division protein PerM n=1 Tax=Streptomyces sp. BI20 TaxID=3403460 RepID=UPI003C766200
MTQVTERGTALSEALRGVGGRRTSAVATCVIGGAVAAGLGLGSLAVLVMVLWISSPYPDSGPGAALHVAAALWLLAHGTELTRPDTLSGVPAPVGITPLLLVALPVRLTWRATRPAPDQDETPPGVTIAAVTGGYLAVATAVTVYALRGPLPVVPLSAAWHVPLVVLTAAAGGVWCGRGRPLGPLPDRIPRRVRLGIARPRYALALRAGSAGALMLAGGGALLLGAALTRHGGPAKEAFTHLTGVWSGRFAVLLLALALLPNAIAWAVSYALGPGFTIGAGAAATPFGFPGSPRLPRFPLLAALPGDGPGGPWTWAVAAVPVLAGIGVGWFAVRRPREVGYGEVAWTTTLAAGVCAALTALLAGASAGALGTGTLASIGPVWWQVGAAAGAWILVCALPPALLVHGWRTRPSRALLPASAPAPGEPDQAEPAGRRGAWWLLGLSGGRPAEDPAPSAPTAGRPDPAAEAAAEALIGAGARWDLLRRSVGAGPDGGSGEGPGEAAGAAAEAQAASPTPGPAPSPAPAPEPSPAPEPGPGADAEPLAVKVTGARLLSRSRAKPPRAKTPASGEPSEPAQAEHN